MPPPIDARTLRHIEAMAIRSTERFWALVPGDLARRLRPRTARVGDAFLTLAAGSDALRMNRVIGLGHQGLAREPMIDEIIDIYRGARLRRFSIIVGPGPQSETIARWLVARGLTPRGGHSLLARRCTIPAPLIRSSVRVVRAGRARADAILAIHERCFALPASRRDWSRAGLRSAGQEQYVAMVGRTVVGAGTLRVDGDLAWLGGGATLTRWRRQGAHHALIVTRLRSAARRGCRWVWVETALPVPGRPQGSRRNLMRLGFEEVCRKPSFIWVARRA
jgi:hypothetical protein